MRSTKERLALIPCCRDLRGFACAGFAHNLAPVDPSTVPPNSTYQAIYTAVQYFQQHNPSCDLHFWVGSKPLDTHDDIILVFDYVRNHLLAAGESSDGDPEIYPQPFTTTKPPRWPLCMRTWKLVKPLP